MKYRDLKRKQNSIMAAARIRFTHKCLMKIALNSVLTGDRIASAAEIHNVFIPFAPNYSLN